MAALARPKSGNYPISWQFRCIDRSSYYHTSFHMFDMDWTLRFRATYGKDHKPVLFLELNQWPPGISSITVRREHHVESVDNMNPTIHTSRVMLYEERMVHGWYGDIVPHHIPPSTMITIKTQLFLMTVLDTDGQDITARFPGISLGKSPEKLPEKFLDKNSKRTSQVTLETLALQIKQLSMEVVGMKKMISKMGLKEEEKIGDDGEDGVSKWLQSTVGLPEYIEVFLDHGFTDWKTVQMITESALEAMGIKSVGHRLLIMHHVGKVNDSTNDDHSEYSQEGDEASSQTKLTYQ